MTDRELDALVAEKVMGLKLGGERPADFYDGEWFVFRVGGPMGDAPVQPTIESDGSFEVLPFYSTDISAAWTVVEEMRRKGFYVSLDVGNDKMMPDVTPLNAEWRAFMYHDDTPEQGDARDTSPARALCLASLEALGVEVAAR